MTPCHCCGWLIEQGVYCSMCQSDPQCPTDGDW